jgi:hypothetical protein
MATGHAIACKQTLRERTSAVKHQNWDSAPLHKLIKIPRHSPLIKYISNYKIMQNIKPEGGRYDDQPMKTLVHHTD